MGEYWHDLAVKHTSLRVHFKANTIAIIHQYQFNNSLLDSKNIFLFIYTNFESSLFQILWGIDDTSYNVRMCNIGNRSTTCFRLHDMYEK